MKSNGAYPLLFTSVYKDYVWGGDRIPRLFRRESSNEICAESWEVSARPEGMSVVRNGPLAGDSLSDVTKRMGLQMLGATPVPPGFPGPDGGSFPLLVKIIDARETASVQVHPDEAAAARHGSEPKTEMWYFLDTAPGAQVCAGLKPGIDRDAFAEALRRDRVGDLLHSLPVRPGDAVFVPGGQPHAVGAGCLLLEVQQSSNTTYRLHDWGRTGHDGRPRPLHVNEAMDVIHWAAPPAEILRLRPRPGPGPNTWGEIQSCPQFEVLRLDLRAPETVSTGGASFHVLFVTAGSLAVSAGGLTERLDAGVSCLLPAALPSYELTPLGGPAAVIRITRGGV